MCDAENVFHTEVEMLRVTADALKMTINTSYLNVAREQNCAVHVKLVAGACDKLKKFKPARNTNINITSISVRLQGNVKSVLFTYFVVF